MKTKQKKTKNLYIGAQLPEMAKVSEADHLNLLDKVYQVVQNSETVEFIYLFNI